MKKSLIIIALSLFTIAFSYAQPNPGQNSGGASVGGDPIGGGAAPVGSGLVLLLTMTAGYGAKKVFDAKKK